MSITLNPQERLNQIAIIGGRNPQALKFDHLNQNDRTLLSNELKGMLATVKAIFDGHKNTLAQINSAIAQESSLYKGSALVGRVSTLERGYQDQMTMLQGKASELTANLNGLKTIKARIELVQNALDKTTGTDENTDVAEGKGCSSTPLAIVAVCAAFAIAMVARFYTL